MANQFESFIQLELPKRPYLEEDAPKESVIIRRGAGPRQLSGLVLEDKQMLAMQNGTLRSMSVTEFLELGADGALGTAEGISHVVELPESQWIIPHDKNSRNVVVTVLDENFEAILYDSLYVEFDKVTINFHTPQSGVANVIFV